MSGYKNFAIVGAGDVGNFFVRQFLKDKAAGTVDEVVVLTRDVSSLLLNTTNAYYAMQESANVIDKGAKVFVVDYSSKESIKNALTGVDVVISAISPRAVGIQTTIAEAAKEAGVKLFLPSEWGGDTEGASEGPFGQKAAIQTHLKALDLPYALFFTGPFSDYIFTPYLWLDVVGGKVTVAGDGNAQISFTSRSDTARYISYVLTHLPAEQLKNRSFTLAGDTTTFNEIFKEYQEKTGKKLEITYVPVSELQERVAANPGDFIAFLHTIFATAGPAVKSDNDIYPGWNPSRAVDNAPVA
ncbi:NAD-P-binding protein [Gloeopeniophorella convolvens]|nr:NAD-P-binding protein [Gloeopeniophorella convolvens]